MTGNEMRKRELKGSPLRETTQPCASEPDPEVEKDVANFRAQLIDDLLAFIT